MAVKTKPVRLFEGDDAVLSMLAGALRQSRSEVAHAALVEFVQAHKEELSQIFKAAQRAAAAGDIDALVAAAQPALDRQVAEIMAGMPKPQA